MNVLKDLINSGKSNSPKEFGQRLANSKKYKSQKIKQKRKRSKK